MRLDVAVIGASIAGLRCAELLALHGARVGLFERNGHAMPARRTLIVTSALRRLLGEEACDAIVLHRISRMTVNADGAEATVQLRKPDLVIERSRTIRLLYRRARTAGVRIFGGCRQTRIEEVASGVRVVLEQGGREIRALASSAVIGADGVQSKTGRAAGLRLPPAVPLLQAEVRLPTEWDPSETKVWFRPEETPFSTG